LKILKQNEVIIHDKRPIVKPKPVVLKAAEVSRDFQQRRDGTLTRRAGRHIEFSF
jgi:hypothetical protein